jgi:hypothetical protein
MRNDNQANETAKQPQQQTGEEFGSLKGRQQRNPERSDTARGSETETRSAASRRG